LLGKVVFHLCLPIQRDFIPGFFKLPQVFQISLIGNLQIELQNAALGGESPKRGVSMASCTLIAEFSLRDVRVEAREAMS
jgi:hypothetical protein